MPNYIENVSSQRGCANCPNQKFNLQLSPEQAVTCIIARTLNTLKKTDLEIEEANLAGINANKINSRCPNNFSPRIAF